MKGRATNLLVHLLVAIALLAGCAPAPLNGISAPITGGPTLLPDEGENIPAQPPDDYGDTAATLPAGEALEHTPAAITQPTAAAGLPAQDPNDWKEWPVVPPQISERAREIYRRGLEMGNRPEAFSKVGDCESITDWYLADFDFGTYQLGPYANLEPVIDRYAGSFERRSLAAKAGFTAASLMVPLWSQEKTCGDDESPLSCEYRLHRPSIALITLGTNDIHRPEKFEGNLRRVIEYSIEQGVLPVLATKADNLEGDDSINGVIARLANEYELPLWNYWLAVQPLPDHGLQEDGAHLTWAPNNFGDPKNLKRAWPVRNLTALQVLDIVWRGVEGN